MIKKLIHFSALTAVHLAAVATIYWFFQPIAKWYLNYRPVWGVDFYLLVSFVSLLREHLVMPYAFWNYAGFAGWPAYIYPNLYAYLTQILLRFFDLTIAVEILMLGATLFFLVGAYFLFFVVSENFILAIVLAIAAAYSSGVYQTLTWAGSLPSYAAQAFFPWSLAFLILYLKSRNMRYLLIWALLSGISIWGHPLIFVIYILPASFILLFGDFSKGLAILEKIKNWAIFLVIALLIGLPLFYSTFTRTIKTGVQLEAYKKAAISTTSATPSELEIGLAAFNREQVKRIWRDNHIASFYLLGFCALYFFLSVVITRKIRGIVGSLSYILVAFYFAFYIWIFGQGISLYHGGWYRLFWSPPIWVGLVASALFKYANANIGILVKSLFPRSLLYVGTSLLMVVLAGSFLSNYTYKSMVNVKLPPRSQASSAYPDILNLKITDAERQELKARLVPKWLAGDETNWRLFDGDQTVNIWWNSMFKMPLARGYIDPPIENIQRGFLFWLDSSLSEDNKQPQLVTSFDYPFEVAISNAQFLIDWNAIRFFEGGHIGAAYSPFPRFLNEFVKNQEVLSFNDLRYTHRPVTLNFYEFKDESTSPILSATNVPTIGIFASDSGYETVVRSIAEKDNLNSQKVIPLKLGRTVDKYDLNTLANFDMLYLYDYDYKSGEKAFKILTKYAESGKKVFVETGVEVKESAGRLSEFFPAAEVERKGQGKEWNLENPSQIFAKDVDFAKFAPPVFDEDEWKISYAKEDDLRDGAQVILKNHGKIVMAKIKRGSGEVIWSGINLAYHLTRNHNSDEARFFINILSGLIDVSPKTVPAYTPFFENANTRRVTTEDARGVLFKEQAYGGWSARFANNDGSRGKLKIFKAGPAYPGFMYVPIKGGKTEVILEYGGSLPNKLTIWISFLVVLLVFEEAVLGGIVIGRVRRFVIAKSARHLNYWWSREDEG